MRRSFVALSPESLTSASSTPQSPCRDENWLKEALQNVGNMSDYLILSHIISAVARITKLNVPALSRPLYLSWSSCWITKSSKIICNLFAVAKVSASSLYMSIPRPWPIICLELQCAKECKSKNQNATCSAPNLSSNRIMAVQYWQYSWFHKTRFRLPFIYHLC